MVSTKKTSGPRRRVSFRGENNEKLASKPEEDEDQAAENSAGLFEIDAFIDDASFYWYCKFKMAAVLRCY